MSSDAWWPISRQHALEHADEGEEQRGVEDVERGRVEADRHRHQREGLLAVDDHRHAGIAAEPAHHPLSSSIETKNSGSITATPMMLKEMCA